jgi:hypothetical protein
MWPTSEQCIAQGIWHTWRDEMCTYIEHIGAMTYVKSTEQTIEQEDVWGMEQTSE